MLVRSAVLLLVAASALARPPTKTRQERPQQPETAGGDGASGNDTKEWDLNIEYNRYLQEVVQVP